MMAITNRPALDLDFSFVDESGSRSASGFNMAYATLAADAETAAGTISPLLTALSGCALVGRSIAYGGRETNTAAILPVADHLVGVKGVFVFNTAAGKTVTYTVPGFDLTKVNPDGNIDTADTDVAAFLTAMLDPANNFTDSNGVALASLSKAYADTR
jgi:hypothetical protein